MRARPEVLIKTKDDPFVDYDLRVYADEGYVVIEETPDRGYSKEVYIPRDAIKRVMKALEEVGRFEP